MRILLVADDQFVAQIDSARGDVSRSAWIRRACENRLNGPKEVMPSAQRPRRQLGLPVNGGAPAPSKAKACAHSETIFKMGARYCVKCGEFV